jgi:hypothetical protein
LLLAYTMGLAVLLTACDAFCHVRTGVLSYTRPEVGSLVAGQPTLDVFIGFVRIAAVCTGLGWLACRRLPPARIGKGLASAATFVACYAATGLAQHWPMALHSLLLVGWLGHLWFYRPAPWSTLALCVALSVAGPLGEGYVSQTGFFAYRQAHAYHVPVWLGGLYLHGGLAIAGTLPTLLAWSKES